MVLPCFFIYRYGKIKVRGKLAYILVYIENVIWTWGNMQTIDGGAYRIRREV